MACRSDRQESGVGGLQNSVRNFPGSGVRPCGWTVSIDYFDRLLGVLIFELRGAEIAQRRM